MPRKRAQSLPTDSERLRRLLIASDQNQLKSLVSQLTDREIEELTYDFFGLWAREKQQYPDGDWFIWIILSGRGFGKTRTGSETVRKWAFDNPGCRIALVGQTKGDVRDTMLEIGESSILRTSPPWYAPRYEPSKRRLVWPNGSIGIVYSGDEPDQLRGPEHHYAWVDELAKFKYPSETWDNLEFGLRKGSQPRVIVTTTPRPIAIIRRLVDDKNSFVVTGSTQENIANLSEQYVDRVVAKYRGTRIGRQEIYGEILDDVPGALWERATLDQTRIYDPTRLPYMSRIVISVDPAISLGDESAETGITVSGKGTDGDGYLFADLSGRLKPDEWARSCIQAFHEFEGDRVVAEINNGGDLVEHTIKTYDRNIPYKAVRAARGKIARAEPIAALYEQGRIHHVGPFEQLEDQLCTVTPETTGEVMQDRYDSLIWGFTDLMIGSGELQVFL